MSRNNEYLDRIKGNFGLILCLAYDGPGGKELDQHDLLQKIHEQIEKLHPVCHECDYFFRICCGVTMDWVEACKNNGQLADAPSCKKVETWESPEVA